MPLIDVPSNSQSSRASSAREPGAESATGRIEILVVCFLLLLRAALALVPNMWLWGFNTQRFLPPLLAWGLWGLWATSLHPAVGPRLTLAITHYGEMLRAHRSTRLLSALALGAVVFWLQDNTWFVGDFLIRRGGGTSTTAFAGNYQQSLPLEVFLFDRAPRLMARFLPEFSMLHRLVGAASSCAVALAAMRFARSISKHATTLAVGAMIVSAGGYLVVATGLGKPAVMLCACVAVLAAIVAVEKPVWSGVAKSGAVTAIAVLLHRSGLLLLPCWALLLYETRRRARDGDRPKALEAIGAGAPILALAAMGPRMWRILVEFDFRHHLAGPNQPWTLQHEFLRLLDLANLCYLLVPALPFLAAVVVRGARLRGLDARLWRLSALTLPWAVALLAIHPQQGIFRDMDVFAAGGVALACFMSFLIIKLLDRKDLDPRVPTMIALAVVVPTVQILLVQHNSNNGLKRVAAYASETPVRAEGELGRTWDFLTLRKFVLRDWRGAAAASARAVSYSPSPRLLLMQGISSAYVGDYAGAVRAYGQAAQRDTLLAEAWLGLAGAAMYQGDRVLADSAMAKVRALSRNRTVRLDLRQMLLSYPDIVPTSQTARRPR